MAPVPTPTDPPGRLRAFAGEPEPSRGRGIARSRCGLALPGFPRCEAAAAK